jgi:hypothetical protein
MKYLLCVPLLSISSVSNDAEATTCSKNDGECLDVIIGYML